jgi:ADP-heptose:LPS heptosyltransferase
MPTASPFESVRDTPLAQTAPAATRRRHPRVLVIRRRYLGDIVLLGSVLRNLRLHWPDAHLTVLTEPAYSGVLALNPDVDGALTFPRRTLQWFGFLRTLRRARFTHVLDFDNTDKTALVARFTSAEVRATYDRELIPFRYRRFYTHTAKVTNAFYDSHHITETYLALPAAIHVPIVSRDVRLVPHADDIAAIARLPGAGRPPVGTSPFRVLVHPGSRSPFRIWPLERFAAVCDALQDRLNAQVILTAGPTERRFVEQIRSHSKTHLVASAAPRDVGTLAALLAQFDVFLCHDSGPMHVAAAVGTPVVALFGSQNSTIWRPLGAQHTVLQTSLPCACLAPATPTPCVRDDSYRSYCVRHLTEDQVFAAVASKM